MATLNYERKALLQIGALACAPPLIPLECMAVFVDVLRVSYAAGYTVGHKGVLEGAANMFVPGISWRAL